MNDFRLVLDTVKVIFVTCALLAVLVAALDAFYHFPLADYLVKKFGDVLMLCVGAIAGLLAGRHYGLKKRANKQA